MKIRLRLGKWSGTFDNRHLVVIFALGVAYAITGFLAWYFRDSLNAESQTTFSNVFRSFYASWAEDVLFFSVVTLVIILMGFRRPEEESFEDRVSILFQELDKNRDVIKHNAKEIRRLAGFSPNSRQLMVVEEYDPEIDAYRVRYETKHRVQNILEDVEYTDTLRVRIVPNSFGTDLPEVGRVTSIKVNGHENIRAPNLITNKEGFFTGIPLLIEPGDVGHIDLEFWQWCRVGEDQAMMPMRVTEVFEMSVKSLCENGSPRIQTSSGDQSPVTLLYNQPFRFPDVRGVSPNERIFEFKFLKPLEN